jgi:hypothetical protein
LRFGGSVVVRFRICADGALDQASLMLPQPPRIDLIGDGALRTVCEAVLFGPPPTGAMTIKAPLVVLMRWIRSWPTLCLRKRVMSEVKATLGDRALAGASLPPCHSLIASAGGGRPVGEGRWVAAPDRQQIRSRHSCRGLVYQDHDPAIV